MRFKLNDIAKATNGKMTTNGVDLPFSSISIDTRKIARGELFVAISGAHFDGHDFLGDAKASGAGALVVKSGSVIPPGIAAIEVKDTTKALGDIASWWRSHFKVPCVAITGSNGKSTTKEMISAIAGKLGPVLKTEGNFNNLIGLPLTIFRWEDAHRTAILEMGMNAAGEIKRLASIVRPDVGIITNITAAHLEKLHTVEAVADAKGELFETMDGRGIAVVNVEDKWAHEKAKMHTGKKITFGMQNDCDVKFMHMDTNGLDGISLTFAASGRELKARIPVPGAHNVMNALAAISVGLALGIDPKESAERLSSFKPMAMRFEQVQLSNGTRVVNDSYNANPESMRAAFRTVGAAKRAGRFIAAIGDMLELGQASKELHYRLGEDAVGMGAELIFVVGDFADEVAKGARSAGFADSQIIECENADELAHELEKELKAGDVLLVKGSRGMRMERVVEYLKTEIGTG